MTPILELRGITKHFPGILANDHIDLTLEQGEILALLGENGAGKTTLMNILYGLYQPDEGEIFVKGTRLEVHQPRDAIARPLRHPLNSATSAAGPTMLSKLTSRCVVIATPRNLMAKRSRRAMRTRCIPSAPR